MMAKIPVDELMLCRLLFLRSERFFLGFLLLGGLAQRILHERDQAAERNEAADREREHERAVLSREDLNAIAGADDTVDGVEDAGAERALAEQLTDDAHGDEHERVAEALEDAVEERRANGVFLAERLGTADDDAVDDDQRDEHAQRRAQRGNVSLQHQVDDRDETRDDQHEDGQTDVIRDDLTDERNDHIAARQDDEHGQAHADAVEEAGRDGHGRAHADELHENRVVGNEAFLELLFDIHASALLNPATWPR